MNQGRQLQVALVLLLATTSTVWAQDSTDRFVHSARRGFLGIGVQDISQEIARELGLSEATGVLVTEVQPGNAAEAAGLKVRDVILSFNGNRVESVLQFHRFIHETPSGRTVTLGIFRNGQTTQLQATLGSRRSHSLQVEPRSRVARSYGSRARLGIKTLDLTDQLANHFGVQTGRGVLITAVNDEGPAAKAGLRAGDIIVALDGERVDQTDDLKRSLMQKQGTISLTIFRDHAQQEVQAPVNRRGERPQPRPIRRRNFHFHHSTRIL